MISCSNDAIQDENDLVVNLAYNTACFNGFGDRWSAWSEGQGDQASVQRDLDCVVDGISYFIIRVRGEKVGVYTSQEIQNFAQRFFKNLDLSKNRIDNILMLKSWLIGGSDQQVSFEELNSLSWFLRTTQGSVKSLTSVAEKIFFKNSDRLLSDRQAVLVKQAVSNISKEFKVLTKNTKASVSYRDFAKVINELTEDLNKEPFDDERLRSFWSLAKISTGQSSKENLSFRPDDGLSDLAFRALYIALRFKYGVLDIGWRDLNSYVHLESVANEVLTFLKNIVQSQPNEKVSSADFNLLAFEAFKFLDFNFDASEDWVQSTMGILFSKYFKSDTFSFQEIELLNSEWQLIRGFYSQTIVLQGLGFSGSLVVAKNFVALDDVNSRALDFAWPMLSDEKGYVLNPLQSTEIIANYGNLFWVNWQKTLATIFLKMYTSDKLRKDNLSGVDIGELETGYDDVFKVLNGINYLGDGEDKAWFRIFNEANLFVPRAKADSYLGFEEGVDYFALLFSGIAFSKDVSNLIGEACPNLTKECQLNWIRLNDNPVWQNFAPDFADYLRSVDDKEWENFAEGLEQMARGDEQDKPFERFELLKASIAIQYIEIFLRKYDSNKNLKINFTETVYSFDKFKAALLSLPQIKGTEAEEDPGTLLSFYAFFLRRGRLPRKTLGQYLELLGWRKKVQNCVLENADGSFEVVDPSGCDYESSRGNLMKILAFLSNSL